MRDRGTTEQGPTSCAKSAPRPERVLWRVRTKTILRQNSQTKDTTAPPQRIIMADLNGLFAPSSALPPDVMGELESMLRLYSISPQELFYKWESYSLKMGSEDTKLNLDTVRMFKKDVQDGLERDSHGRHVGRGSERKSNIAATPRSATTGGDVFGMQVCVIRLPLLVANVCL
jgi:hypothetical protein